jgi:hypothetical protein
MIQSKNNPRNSVCANAPLRVVSAPRGSSKPVTYSCLHKLSKISGFGRSRESRGRHLDSPQSWDAKGNLAAACFGVWPSSPCDAHTATRHAWCAAPDLNLFGTRHQSKINRGITGWIWKFVNVGSGRSRFAFFFFFFFFISFDNFEFLRFVLRNYLAFPFEIDDFHRHLFIL